MDDEKIYFNMKRLFIVCVVYIGSQILISLMIYIFSISYVDISTVQKFIPYVDQLYQLNVNPSKVELVGAIYFANIILFAIFILFTLIIWGLKPFVAFSRRWYGFVLLVVFFYPYAELVFGFGDLRNPGNKGNRIYYVDSFFYYLRYGLIPPVMNVFYVVFAVLSYDSNRIFRINWQKRSRRARVE